MSGHGKREAASRANAIAWRDRVIDDVRGQQGGAAASAYEVSADLVIAAAEIIAAYMAAGESEISRTDLKRSGRRSGYAIGTRQELLLRYLEDRGHIERCADRELIRPIGILPPELPFA